MGFHPSYSLFLSDFNQTSSFWTDFEKIIKRQFKKKIRLFGAELFYADGQTGVLTGRQI